MPEPTPAARPSPLPTRQPTARPTATAAPSPTPTPPPRVTLAAVGDVMLARSIGDSIEDDSGFDPFGGVAARLRAADVTVGNLECAVGAGGTPEPKAYTFRAPPAAARALDRAGFDVLSLANNHALDYGPALLDRTRRILEARGIRHVGSGESEADARRPSRITVNGLRLAFLAYVRVPIERRGYDPSAWAAEGDRGGVAWARTAEIAADVRRAKRDADHVVVLLHTGDEGESDPNDFQRDASRGAIDAGATLVLGAHPHELQGAERYRGGLIAYSLGNFVFDGFEGTANETAILRVTLGRRGIERVGWTPVVIEDGLPRLASGERAREILDRLETLSDATARRATDHPRKRATRADMPFGLGETSARPLRPRHTDSG